MRKIYVEPLWRLPASYSYLIEFPPAGYQFVADRSARSRAFTALSRWRVSYRLQWLIDNVIPVALAKACVDRWCKPLPDTLLTYAHGHLVLRREPWVVEVEYASLLLEDHPKFVLLFRSLLERMLSDPYCRKIRCWSEAGLRTVTEGLRSEGFAHKTALIPPAVPPRRFLKTPDSTGRMKLLFVGSRDIKGQFDVKGGREALETFLHLRRRYQNLEFVVRSDVPADVRARFSGVEGLRIIEEDISWEELEREYRSTDIFLLPSHSTPPFTLLDAMSFELPVVSIDAWANGEFIADGKTGMLTDHSQKVPYRYRGTIHPNFGTAQFARAIRQTDPEVVGDLVYRTNLLLENAELRRRLGRAARWEVEKGKFSIAVRNGRLARFLDEAIADRAGTASHPDSHRDAPFSSGTFSSC